MFIDKNIFHFLVLVHSLVITVINIFLRLFFSQVVESLSFQKALIVHECIRNHLQSKTTVY